MTHIPDAAFHVLKFIANEGGWVVVDHDHLEVLTSEQLPEWIVSAIDEDHGEIHAFLWSVWCARSIEIGAHQAWARCWWLPIELWDAAENATIRDRRQSCV